MIASAEMQEYLDQIRQEVCSRCVERPAGGPPCLPLGKPCGVELHLPQLVAAVQQVHSPLVEPYLETNRQEVCPTCPYLHHPEFCPCPMDRLAVLVVGAIETVDQRRQRREHGHEVVASLEGHDRPELAEVVRVYEEAAGSWTGCDWPTTFGLTALNLEGWTAEEAEDQAIEVNREQRQTWEDAACWLEEVERRGEEAEAEAEMALRTATAGDWVDAAEHARRAWNLEFTTGRTFRRQPPTWQRFYEVVTLAAWAHDRQEAVNRRFSITVLNDS